MFPFYAKKIFIKYKQSFLQTLLTYFTTVRIILPLCTSENFPPAQLYKINAAKVSNTFT